MRQKAVIGPGLKNIVPDKRTSPTPECGWEAIELHKDLVVLSILHFLSDVKSGLTSNLTTALYSDRLDLEFDLSIALLFGSVSE